MPPAKLPSIITPAFLSSIRSTPHLPPHTYYFIAGVTLSTLNRPDEITKVLTYALEHGHGTEDEPIKGETEQLKVARRMREALVKSAAVVGLPKTINALFSLKKATPTHLLDTPPAQAPSGRTADITSPSAAILARGTAFFDKVYGKISGRVMGQMDNSGTPDLGLTARVAYGYILSGGDKILSPAETSFVLLAALVPQDVNPQLKGHLKGAVNNEASVEEVRAVRGVAVRLCEAAGMRRLKGEEGDAWGWREEVENLEEGWGRAKAKL